MRNSFMLCTMSKHSDQHAFTCMHQTRPHTHTHIWENKYLEASDAINLPGAVVAFVMLLLFYLSCVTLCLLLFDVAQARDFGWTLGWRLILAQRDLYLTQQAWVYSNCVLLFRSHSFVHRHWYKLNSLWLDAALQQQQQWQCFRFVCSKNGNEILLFC